MIASMRGDDSIIHRLLTLLKKERGFIQLQQLRKNVYYVQTVNGEFILKGFLTRRELMIQEKFINQLYQKGFIYTPMFVKTKKSFYVAPYYFAWFHFVKEGFPSFHYRYELDRISGLTLLNHYHATSEKLVKEFTPTLSSFHLINKWSDRLFQFVQHTPYLTYYLSKEKVAQLIQWGEWSLTGVKHQPDIFYVEKKVILHGDVAHHNFIRDEKRQVYLIDFDLISIGCRANDLIQYVNRILPAIKWSYEKLASYEQLQFYLNETAFLYALAFPADIYREWNRLLRTNRLNEQKLSQLIHLTNTQFSLRQQFINRVKSVVN